MALTSQHMALNDLDSSDFPHKVDGQIDTERDGGISETLRFTKLCNFYLQGNCNRGSRCSFAHDPQQVRPTPNLAKTLLCGHIVSRGYCKRGSDCRFAHSLEELRDRSPVVSATQPVISKSLSSAQPPASLEEVNQFMSSDHCFDANAQVGTNDLRFTNLRLFGSSGNNETLKYTKQCNFFLQGACARGDSCTFAHDPQQLQPLPNLLKTGFCRQILAQGYCKHGANCRFAHHQDQIRVCASDAKEPGLSKRQLELQGRQGTADSTASTCASASSTIGSLQTLHQEEDNWDLVDSDGMCYVKNTFVHIEALANEHNNRRTRSLPPMRE
eukprot:TRINITY_DN94075_c0_g1_i1.p1 TRINITY_DN94075_c0_g1~~TRINITY_DN94075_c0_g1_i1.p1  ORF type:complete len:328 (+),score=56.29 TRINITY_DN94075_c0_g1_i1:119-1102(+)